MEQNQVDFINSASRLGAISGVETDSQGALAISLLDLANDHARSIAHLINLKLYASALALVRPCIESVIRGLWVFHCVETLESAERHAVKDGSWPSLESMVKSLDNTLENDSFFGKRYLGKNYGVLSSFTHGLSYQTANRFDGKVMTMKLSSSDTTAIMSEVCYLSYLSNLTIAYIADEQGVVENLKQLWSKSEI
ncbi:hypothetical protein K6Q96_07030 [Grimontia kaedaensis]|uniref:AbiV family abortive infection protein n=1 Tax=Grimontia kaedaensis TaxID=2872157 RepID=A0ABY4WXL1_9GAMM|nr:hypothetical protein [Grimontia kaedaensis]EIC5077175.1 hypothetical protein [Vibrio parahaemolyticus]USH03739.1 hypothetical protein K6Q96_07030 [Grimontia kaedaensis]